MNSKFKLSMQLMKGNWLLYAGAVVSVMAAGIFAMVCPLVIRATIDSVIGNKELDVPGWLGSIIESWGGTGVLAKNLWICSLALLALTLLQGIFSFARGKWAAQASEEISRRLRDKLYEKFQKLPYDYHVKAKTGDLIQRSTSDVETIRRFLSFQLVEVGNTVFMVIVVFIIMMSLNIKMALLSVVVLPVLFTFSIVFFKKIKDQFKLCEESEGKLSTVLQENLTGIRVVKAFGREAFEYEKFDKKNDEYTENVRGIINYFALYWSSSDLMSLSQTGIVTVAGIYATISGQITLGTFFVFLAYVGMLLWPVRQLGRILTDMGKMVVAMDRINEILEKEQENMNEKGKRPIIKGNIEFHKVCFGYEGDENVIKDVSFKVKSGQTVAILGPTGSGKSTLMHLLQRLYDYRKGSIIVDGVELKEIEKNWLRKHIGIVLQEPFLFSRTIKENICLAKLDVREEEMFEAARTAAVHDVVNEFDKGYETIVGERGVTLSGGQKQRVAMARSLIRSCPIVIFDDSLSAVDTETDALIRKAIRESNKKVTTFIISHRITTLSQADAVVVLKDGMIEQYGSHSELISQEGLYKKLWNLAKGSEKAV